MREIIRTRISPHDRETRLKGTHSLDPIQWLDLTDAEVMRRKIEDVLKNSVDIVLERNAHTVRRTIYDYDDLHCPKCSHVQLINPKTCDVPDEDKPMNKFIEHLTLCQMDQATLDMQNENDVIHDDVLALLRQAQDKQKRVQVTPFGDHRPHGYVLKLPITSPLAHLIARGAKVSKTKKEEAVDQFVISVKIPVEGVPSLFLFGPPPTFTFVIDFEKVFKINVQCMVHRIKKEREKMAATAEERARIAAGEAKRIAAALAADPRGNKAKKRIVGGPWLESSNRAPIKTFLLDKTKSSAFADVDGLTQRVANIQVMNAPLKNSLLTGVDSNKVQPWQVAPTESSAARSTVSTRSQSQPSTSSAHLLSDDCIILDSSDDDETPKKKSSAPEVLDLDSSSSSEDCVVVFDKSGR